MRWFVLSCFWGVLFWMQPAFAQDCTYQFSGRIVDQATGEHLEFSAIALQEGNRMVLADSVGFFVFDNLCPGDYHIQAYHVGCPPGHYFISITGDTNVVLRLDHHSQLLREIQIEGERGTFQESQVRHIISEASIRNDAGQTLAALSSRVAGVNMLRTGNTIGKPVIHGLYGNRIAVINNGLLQAGQQWGADHAPEIDPNSIDVITVVKSSDALAYGSQAIGGAVVVESGRIPDDPHLHGAVGYAFRSNGRGHTLTGRLQRSSGQHRWRITGSFQRAGDMRTPDYFLTNSGARTAGASLQWQYSPSLTTEHRLLYTLFDNHAGIFTGAHIGNLTDLAEAIGRDMPFRISDEFSYHIEAPQQRTSHHLIKYSGRKFLEERKSLEWMYGLQYNHRKEYDIRRGNQSDLPALNLRQWAHTLDIKYIHDKDRVSWKSGIQLRATDNTNDYETGILPLIPDYFKASAGWYALAQYPTGRLTLEAGARVDGHLLQAWVISPWLPREILQRKHQFGDVAISTGAMYRPSKWYEIHGQIVGALRSPEPNELYSNGLHQGVAGIEEGDWNLLPETSIKVIGVQTLRFESLFHVEAHLWSHVIRDYIYLHPQDELRLTIRGAFPVFRYEQDDAWLRGIDLVVVSEFSHHLELNTRFSWMRGAVIGGGRNLTQIPPASVATSLSWAFHDNALLKGARVQLEGMYTASQKHWDAERDFLAPPGDYFLFHIKLSSGFRFSNKLIHAGLAVENLFNLKYRDYLNRFRYFADEPGRTVNVFARYEF